MKVVLAIDAGTTGNRVIAFNEQLEIVAQSYYEFPQIHPQPGWVEQDPIAIWQTTRQALNDVLAQIDGPSAVAIGITNQRETCILWDRDSGKPLYNAIVWQCRRTTKYCQELEAQGILPMVREKTGLFLDPYFSATKINWLIQHVAGVKEAIAANRVLCGTVDSWLLWNLTKGSVHATDASNASRTLCYNIRTGQYDDELLDIFGIPRSILPEVRDSAGEFGLTNTDAAGVELPIMGILGDQQAALFGQGGWAPGVVKNTYGTGLFLMAGTGQKIPSSEGLLATVAWQLDGTLAYAVEGGVFVGGACIQWLRDKLGIIEHAADTAALAEQVPDTGDVYFVPAMAGLGAPYWDSNARGTIVGLSLSSDRRHIVRAALESLAYQTRDLVTEMRTAAGADFACVRVDGGAAQNDFLMQFQSDILGLAIERPALTESTAAGAAGIAGIHAGVWTRESYAAARRLDRVFQPAMAAEQANALYARWQQAVERSGKWAS